MVLLFIRVKYHHHFIEVFLVVQLQEVLMLLFWQVV